MKIDYIRNMNVSHMVLEQKIETAEWENEMILHNKIEGILFAECVCENGKRNLWFDITGKQSLDILLASSELNYAMLCRILSCICSAISKLDSLLLIPDALLMIQDCIFIDNQTEELYFCYYPGNEEKLSEAVCNLMEFLLTRLDHNDTKAVDAAYALYEQMRKEGSCLADIRNAYCIPYEREDTDTPCEQEKGDSRRDIPVLETKYEPAKNETEQEEWRQKVLQKPKKKKGIERFLPALDIKEVIAVQLKNIWADHTSFKWGKYKTRKRKEAETFIFEPEEEDEVKPARPTVLLSEITKKPIGLLRYEGAGACSDLKIDATPYMIGSEPACDGCIISNTISRRHARITKTEDIYFIEDLNSSNGTFVGGKLLNYRVRMSLSPNETVIFADEKFRFI